MIAYKNHVTKGIMFNRDHSQGEFLYPSIYFPVSYKKIVKAKIILHEKMASLSLSTEVRRDIFFRVCEIFEQLLFCNKVNLDFSDDNIILYPLMILHALLGRASPPSLLDGVHSFPQKKVEELFKMILSLNLEFGTLTEHFPVKENLIKYINLLNQKLSATNESHEALPFKHFYFDDEHYEAALYVLEIYYQQYMVSFDSANQVAAALVMLITCDATHISSKSCSKLISQITQIDFFSFKEEFKRLYSIQQSTDVCFHNERSLKC